MDDQERRRYMNGLRGAASYLNHLDTDDFADDAVHGETAVRWAVNEIERLDRLVGIYECRANLAIDDQDPPDDMECEHDHTRSSLEPPRPTPAESYERRIMVMQKSWPSGDPYTEYTVMHPRASDETGDPQ